MFFKNPLSQKILLSVQNFKKKWEHFLNEAETFKDSEYINKIKFSLYEALQTIEEHQHWLNLCKMKSKQKFKKWNFFMIPISQINF